MPRMHVSKSAASLLALMGKGWSFTPYPANGPQKELQLRHDGRTIVYVVDAKSDGDIIARYPQTGFKSTGAVKPSRKLATQIRKHSVTLAKARATKKARGK